MSDAADQTAVDPPRPPRSRRRARSRRVPFAIAAAALAVFAAAAVWLANWEEPIATHADALRMAAAVERAVTIEELDRLVEFPSPGLARQPMALGGPRPTPADLIHFAKRARYTFVYVRKDERGDRLLLFRQHLGTILIDYHELRLRRATAGVRIVDLWSAQLGAWAGDLLTFQFGRAIEFLCTSYLNWMAVRRPEAAARLLPLFRAMNPHNVAPDLLVVSQSHRLGLTDNDVHNALDRLHARFGDGDFLEQVREGLGPR